MFVILQLLFLFEWNLKNSKTTYSKLILTLEDLWVHFSDPVLMQLAMILHCFYSLYDFFFFSLPCTRIEQDFPSCKDVPFDCIMDISSHKLDKTLIC